MSQKKAEAVEKVATPAPLLFTDEEVKFTVTQTVGFVLHNVTNLLLDSGAPPSGEIGKIIMHLSSGAMSNRASAAQALEKLAATPEGVERINILQGFISEQTK